MENGILAGVIPAVLTPFNQAGRVHETGLRQLVAYFIDQKVGGLYITGSTGEGFMMSKQERLEVARIVVDATKKAAPQLPIIAQIASLQTEEAMATAQSMEELGVDGLSSVPPYYYPCDEELILGYYQELSSASSLPFYVYNIPDTTNINMSEDFLSKLLQLKNVVGLKHSSMNTYLIGRLHHRHPESCLCAGSDETALFAFMQGADAIIGSSYNVLADLFCMIYRAYKENQWPEALRLFQIGNDILSILLKYPYFDLLKKILTQRGIEMGQVRRPLKRMETAHKTAFEIDLRILKKRYAKEVDIDFFK